MLHSGGGAAAALTALHGAGLASEPGSVSSILRGASAADCCRAEHRCRSALPLMQRVHVGSRVKAHVIMGTYREDRRDVTAPCKVAPRVCDCLAVCRVSFC